MTDKSSELSERDIYDRMKYDLKFGSAVTVIPAAATEKIINGAASASETAVLMAIASRPEIEADNEKEYAAVISDITGLDIEAVIYAIAFWRGASVLSLPNGRKNGGSLKVASSRTDPQSAKTPEKAISAKAADTEVESGAASAEAPKKLMSEEVPKYSPELISEVLERDGRALAAAIDQCQSIIGRIFNPHDIEVIVGFNDYLGLEPDYIVTMCAYYAKKRPKCTLHYIEKAAYSLVNDGIITLEALDAHIKAMEIYDGVARHLRKLLGIGERAFAKNENEKIKRWINDFGYGTDILDLCYDITVSSIGNFNFNYADRILEDWYKEGVRTVEDAQRVCEEFKGKAKNSKNAAGVSVPSFDGNEFLKLAIKRSLDS